MNRADRTLLELAATAAGYLFDPTVKGQHGLHVASEYDQGKQYLWNSLTDDGDAARLAADLNVTVAYGPMSVTVFQPSGILPQDFTRVELYGRDRHQAARLAITLLAYDIGQRAVQGG